MSSGAASRRKGLSGERECADVFVAAGWTVRGLESSGDWLALRSMFVIPRGADPSSFLRVDRTLHIEAKRQERLRIPEWLAQAENEAPPGVPPVVVFRQNKGRWYAALPLDDLLGLIA